MFDLNEFYKQDYPCPKCSENFVLRPLDIYENKLLTCSSCNYQFRYKDRTDKQLLQLIDEIKKNITDIESGKIKTSKADLNAFKKFVRKFDKPIK